MHRDRQNKDGIYWFRCYSQWKYAKEACTVVSVKEADLMAGILTTLCSHSEVIRSKLLYLESVGNKIETNKSEAELRKIKQDQDKN